MDDMQKKLIAIGLIIFVVWFVSWVAIVQLIDGWADRSAFGSMFGAVNALFAGLAFAGVVVALYLQRQELSLQREELRATREEIQRQTAAQEKSEQTLSDQVSALHAQASAIVAQTDELMRPNVVIFTEINVDGGVDLVVTNIGRNSAEKLRLIIDRNLSPFPSGGDGHFDIDRHYVFNNEMSTFAPGAMLRLYIGWIVEHLVGNTDGDTHTLIWKIRSRYEFKGQVRDEVYVIDLHQYEKRLKKKDEQLEALKKVSGNVERIAEATGNLANLLAGYVREESERRKDTTSDSQILR